MSQYGLPDNLLFDRWFSEAYPKPAKTPAQKARRTYRKNLLWRGWCAARQIPKQAVNPLIYAEITGLTPEAMVEMGRHEGERSKSWQQMKEMTPGELKEIMTPNQKLERLMKQISLREQILAAMKNHQFELVASLTKELEPVQP